MARIYYLFIFCFLSITLSAQNSILIKYYDALWNPTSKDSAFYFTEFVPKDRIYDCTSYWMKSKKIFCKSTYADTLFARPLGLLLRYHENGQVQDSAYYDENGQPKYIYHYYSSGKLWAHYSYDRDSKKETAEGFDEQGKAIKGFIYLKEAEFPGGLEAWSNYLAANVNTKVPIKNGAPNGAFEVVIAFVVNKSGYVSDVEAKTSYGYGMEEEAMRVIKRSPRWRPLILLGKPENAFRRQPITFVISDK